MRKTFLTALAAIAVIGAVSSTPAEARCWWNGYYWQCPQPRHNYYRRHHHRHHNYREGWDWRHDYDRRHGGRHG